MWTESLTEEYCRVLKPEAPEHEARRRIGEPALRATGHGKFEEAGERAPRMVQKMKNAVIPICRPSVFFIQLRTVIPH